MNAEHFREKLVSTNSLLLITLLLIGLSAVFLGEPAVLTLFLLTVLFAEIINLLDLNRIGLELATFSTVIIASQAGMFRGAAAGFALVIGQMACKDQLKSYSPWIVIGYMVAGATIGLFNPSNIFRAGLVTVLVLRSLFAIFAFLFESAELTDYLPYALMNIAFNILLFQYLALEVLTYLQ